jgi:hypothetical protein
MLRVTVWQVCGRLHGGLTPRKVAAFLADRMEEARAYVVQMRNLEKPKADLLALLKKHNPKWTEVMATMLLKAGRQA